MQPAQENEDKEPFKSMKTETEQKDFVAELHKLKTNLFMDMVVAGRMPLRPGVARLIGVEYSGPEFAVDVGGSCRARK